MTIRTNVSTWRAAVAASLALAVIGCQSQGLPELQAAPDGRALIEPGQVQVKNLVPGKQYTVTLESRDSTDVLWRGTRDLPAPSSGTISLDQDELQAAMLPTDRDHQERYLWGDTERTFRLKVGGTGVTWRATLAGQPVAVTSVQVGDLRGTYYAPVQRQPEPTSAVLLLGGSEGGYPNPQVAHMLAGSGHPVLGLAYFGVDGLPQHLHEIPLEYFQRALAWLGKQPGVDPDRLAVYGNSFGGQAALLLASFSPQVRAVIASVPSNVVTCGFPCSLGSAWTKGGQPLRYTRQRNLPEPNDDAAAVIPIERFRGRVLLNCGALDTVWDSCAYAEAVVKRLSRAAVRPELFRCDQCNHYVGFGIPGEALPELFHFPYWEADSAAHGPFMRQAVRFLGAVSHDVPE